MAQETYLCCWPITSPIHLWHHLGSLYILGSSSAGTAASSLVDHQTTSIHQHKSAQRGANCIRRPFPFLGGLCVCVYVRGYVGWVELWEERRLVKESVGCWRSRGYGVWRCGLGAGQPSKASGRDPLFHLCSCWQHLRLPLQTQTYIQIHRMWKAWFLKIPANNMSN